MSRSLIVCGLKGACIVELVYLIQYMEYFIAACRYVSIIYYYLLETSQKMKSYTSFFLLLFPMYSKSTITWHPCQRLKSLGENSSFERKRPTRGCVSRKGLSLWPSSKTLKTESDFFSKIISWSPSSNVHIKSNNQDQLLVLNQDFHASGFAKVRRLVIYMYLHTTQSLLLCKLCV